MEFFIDTYAGPDATEYRLLITTVSLVGGQFDPGTVLFESPVLVDPLDAQSSYTLVKVDTGKLALTPGVTYAFVLDAAVAFDTVNSQAPFGLSRLFAAGTDFTDGFVAYLINTTGTRTTDFNVDWNEASGSLDLSFRLSFSNPGVTIAGTKGKNIVDATHAPKGQPLPTGGDDSISGLGDRDKLSGLGGDDTLDGGEDKDTLFGGDGQDLFLFSVGIRKNAPDKVMDFVAMDDTILLAMAKFKGLAQGAITDGLFRDIGEVATDADRVIYKASGKLLFDKDGKGSDDPHGLCQADRRARYRGRGFPRRLVLPVVNLKMRSSPLAPIHAVGQRI